MSDRRAFRAAILHCLGDPGEHADARQVEYFSDGLLIIEDGHVAGLGDAESLLPGLADDFELHDHRGNLIVPGFVDCHVHFSQVDIIASYGEQLLDWLNRYAFPVEAQFGDAQFAHEVAEFFVDELLRNGTTSALVFPTVHEESVEAIFTAAGKRNMRLLSGKVLMDQNCPESVRDGAESTYTVSRRLLEKWHGKGRLGYALTPRFAVTSSEAQLKAVGKLAAEFPDVHIHTHLAENHEEIELVAERFPLRRSYLDVYEHFGLVRERAVFAHCLHLDNQDRKCMAGNGSAMAFCPTSNLFLGSGLFNLRSARDSGIRVGLATDVGGGTSLGMLQTMSEAYKVLHLQSQSLPGFRALYLATLGAAEALYLDDKIGNFVTGKEADFVILNYAGAEITRRRLARAEDIAEKLFALIMLGDDRNISATHVMGQRT